jgi:hypothetical protein
LVLLCFEHRFLLYGATLHEYSVKETAKLADVVRSCSVKSPVF